jgi:hypothetical protein
MVSRPNAFPASINTVWKSYHEFNHICVYELYSLSERRKEKLKKEKEKMM